MHEKYEIISSCINTVIMVSLFPQRLSMKYSYVNNESSWNYWNAESTLSMELNIHISQLTEAENVFRSFESKLQNLHLDEKEFSLLLLMIITRTSKREEKMKFYYFLLFKLDLNLINEENKIWSKCQYECVQLFSEYTQGLLFISSIYSYKNHYLARRLNSNGELSFEFYDIIFLVSQLRSLNRQISKCLMNLSWPYIGNLPSFFYRIYLPTTNNMSTILNSNYKISSFFSQYFHFVVPSNNNQSNIWTTPMIGSSSEVCLKIYFLSKLSNIYLI